MILLTIDYKAVAGVLGVILAFLGGCGVIGPSPGDRGQHPGMITGRVKVETVDLLPGNPEGWEVALYTTGSDNRAVLTTTLVTADGSYTLSQVPPGIYEVALNVASAPTSALASVPVSTLASPGAGEVIYTCLPADCLFKEVVVAPDTITMNVNFTVSAMPAPPF
ncbi:MAG TPA: hypothetical protein GXX29_03820 [Firmicutes bacterium]|nr:hypothetical protein [Bacillota bacterium]